jgi:hypothetical protein
LRGSNRAWAKSGSVPGQHSGEHRVEHGARWDLGVLKRSALARFAGPLALHGVLYCTIGQQPRFLALHSGPKSVAWRGVIMRFVLSLPSGRADADAAGRLPIPDRSSSGRRGRRRRLAAGRAGAAEGGGLSGANLNHCPNRPWAAAGAAGRDNRIRDRFISRLGRVCLDELGYRHNHLQPFCQ